VLIGLFGSPSPLTYWTLAALRSTVDVCLSGHAFVETPSLAPLREALASRDGRPVVYFCDCPQSEVARAFLESGAPYLVCLEPPTEVMGFCVRERNMQPLHALRFAAQSLSSLHDLALGPKARGLRRRADRMLSQAVIDLCATYRLTDNAKAAAEAVRRLAGGPDLMDLHVEELIQGYLPNARPIGAAGLDAFGVPDWMVEIANQYAPLLDGRALDRLFWPREAFLDPRGPDEAVLPKQDLFGPSRHLVFGPFLHLPAGTWRASVRIQVAGAHASAMRADVAIQGVPVQIVRFNLPQLGMFEFALDFVVNEPREFVEVRIELLRAELEGQFAFGGVELQRL
jgi:hypothetical protein